MKKRHIGLLPLLFAAIPIFAATIRVYNKLGNNKKITVTAITPKKRMVEPIESMRSHFFNTWFAGINGFEWETDGYIYAAPLEMRALQTEGRLYIKKDGKYSFQPCLPCKESQGNAKVIQSPTPTAPSKNEKKSTIPAPPPLPKNDTRKRPQDGYLEAIKRGKKLRKVQPPSAPTSQENDFLQEIKSGKTLKSSSQRILKAKPDTRTQRENLLESIQNKPSLRKTSGPQKKAPPKHELHDPLSKAIDAQLLKRRQIVEPPYQDEENSWEDEDDEYMASPAA